MPDTDGSADLQPTENYSIFRTAEQLHKTARELLTGQPGALTYVEHYLWQVYRTATARLDQQARPLHAR